MEAKAWSNGITRNNGAGYGFRITPTDRDNHFNRSWGKVLLELEGEIEAIEIRLSKSFWDGCPELRDMRIGRWLIRNSKAPWPKRYPPKLNVESKGVNVFSVSF